MARVVSAVYYSVPVILQPRGCASCWASSSASVLRYHGVPVTTRSLFACCPGGCAGGSPVCGLSVRRAFPCVRGPLPAVHRSPGRSLLLRLLSSRGPLVVAEGRHAMVLCGFRAGLWYLADSATGSVRAVRSFRPRLALVARFAHDG